MLRHRILIVSLAAGSVILASCSDDIARRGTFVATES